MEILLSFYNEEDGIGSVWFALIFIAITFIAGIAIDTGRLYEARTELRKVANAAVLSGAQELEISDSSVENVVDQILAAHNEQDSLEELLIRPNNKNRISVTLKKEVPLHFMRIFSFDSATVEVRSSAGIFPIAKASGAVPLGIHKDTPLEFMKEYELKADAGGSEAGNFGILALSGVGAKNYEETLKHGYDKDVEIGQIIDTQTGNVAQKTVNGVNYRIDASPYPVGDITHRDDPRIITILVYEPYFITTNQVKSVKVCGFAYFYLKEPMSQQDSTIKGYFIKKVGTGIGEEDALDKGAYAIKLVE